MFVKNLLVPAAHAHCNSFRLCYKTGELICISSPVSFWRSYDGKQIRG